MISFFFKCRILFKRIIGIHVRTPIATATGPGSGRDRIQCFHLHGETGCPSFGKKLFYNKVPSGKLI